ncbi:MAG: NADH-quinone oxidoreductase subunit K [Candidatus Margulisiibacteriota bacterium]
MISYLGCLTLFLIGLYGVMVKRHIYKIVISLLIMEFAVDYFLVLIGNRKWGTALIVFSATLIAVAIIIRLQESFGTLDAEEIKELKG